MAQQSKYISYGPTLKAAIAKVPADILPDLPTAPENTKNAFVVNAEFWADWTEAIMRGITACRVFVLVFSENANVSGHVRREVAKAFSVGLQVIPFRIEDTLPQSSLSYFLETVYWLDAVTQP